MYWESLNNKVLVQAFLTLKTPDEVRRFLRDLMTEEEINEFAKRLKAAIMLTANIPYITIVKETGLSSTTVARVSKWLKGSQGGYRTIINRLNSHTKPARAR